MQQKIRFHWKKRGFDISEEEGMKRCTIILLVAVLFSVGFANEKVTFDNNWADNPLFNVISQTPFGIEVIFSTHEMIVEEMDLDEIPMKTYGVPGIFLPNDEGAPNLAGTGRYIAIPQGAQVKITILDSRKEVYHNVEIAPAPNIPLDSDDSPLRYVKDMEIYDSDAYYPETPVQVSEPEKMRGVDVVVLGITPFQYNPVTKELVVYKDIRVKLDFIGGNGYFGDNRLRSRFWEPILQGNLLNYSALPKVDFYSQERTLPTDGYGYEYIIIVPDDPVFEAWADTIKNWRRLQGISSEVFTLTEIGGSSYNDIKGFLKNAYETWDPAPVAFLLLSDYPSSGDSYGITSKWFWHPYSGTYVSDNWYAEMDANTLPDLDYARICAQTETQLSTMINKFLSYERSPYTDAGFYSNPLVACAWQTERWFQLCSEVVRGFFIISQSRTPARQYAIYSGTPTVGCAWSTATNTATVVSYWSGLGYIPATNQNDATWWNNGSAAGISAAINSGAFLVQHRDHGATWGWGEPQYTTTNLNDLTNTMYTFVYSTNCLTGQYDYANEVFTEKFHRIDFGAMGVNAASQISYSFVNDTYVWGCYDGLWSDFDPGYPAVDITGHDNLRPCQAMTYGKYYLSASSWPYNSSRKSVTYRLFHHHGDAFSILYSEVPQSLTVSHNPTLTAGAKSFTVTADDSSVIALTIDHEIIGVVEGTGSPVVIPITPQSPGKTMKVTVTKANYYRYEVDVPVVLASGPYPMVTTTIIDDASGGNNDGAVNPGEMIDYGMYIRNVGDATANDVFAYLSEQSSYITVNTDSSWYGTIASNDSVLSNSYYEFTVANNCPNNYEVVCSLAIYDNSKTLYVSYPTFTVFASVLVYQSNAITGDGNGDGKLDPGETADLVVTVRNDGGAVAVNVTSTLETTSPYITINDDSGNFGTIAPRNTADNSGDPYNITADGGTPAGSIIDFSVIVLSGVYCDTLKFILVVPDYGSPVDTSSGITGPEHFQIDPKVAFGSSNYIVLWSSNRRDNTIDGYDVYASRVTMAGEIIDTFGIRIASNDSYLEWAPSVAFDGTNWLIVWRDERSGYGDIYGTRIDQNGNILDPGGIAISTAAYNQFEPEVSFNGTNYLVVWSDGRHGDVNQGDVYCARVTPAGTVLDPSGIPIRVSSTGEAEVHVGSDANNWFVVWTDWRSGVRIYGARISPAGTVFDPNGFLISSAANDRRFPDVDFDGSNYFVVWQDRRSGTGVNYWSVYGARVTTGGTVLDPSGIPIANNDSYIENLPAVEFNGVNHLVVYKDGNRGEATGARVTPAGVVLDPGGFPISGGPLHEQWFDIACDGTNWFVIWEDARSQGEGYGTDINGARVASDGTVLDPYPDDVRVSLVATWQFHPSAVFDGTNYFIAWQEKTDPEEFDIHGIRVDADGNALDIPAIPICSDDGHQIEPDVASGLSNYLVVWQDNMNDPVGDIRGARVSHDGTVLDPSGIDIAVTAWSVDYYPAVAFDGTNYLVVWWKWWNSNYRIFGTRVSQDGIVLDPTGWLIATPTWLSGWNNHVSLGVAFDGTNYLVVWSDGRNGDWDIYGARVHTGGWSIDPSGFPVGKMSGSDQDYPDLTYGGSKYYAVWHDSRGDGNIYGVAIDTSGVSDDTSGSVISNAVGGQLEPAICCTGSRYVTIWKDYRNNEYPRAPDVYCARMEMDGTMLDPTGMEVSVERYRQFEPCVTSGPGGDVLLAYSSYSDEPYCASRIFYQIKTIDPDNVPPLATSLYAEKFTFAGNSMKLTWNKITQDINGNPEYMSHYVVYRGTSPDFIPGVSDSIGFATHPDTTYIDVGALSTSDSYYYLIKAADQSDNKSSKSNMGYKLNKFVNENAGATGDRNWVSLPWYSEYDSVPDLTADLSPAGDPLTKITDLRDDQVFENWIYHPVLGWYGDTFDISAGRGYEMIATTDDTVILVGSNDPVGFIPLNENPGAIGDRNWVSIPYNALYDRVIDITDEYSSGGEAVIKITDLRDDQIFENWIHHPVLGWYGDTFDINAGRAYEFVAVLDTTWNPTEYTNESGFDRLAARQKKSDTKVRLGTLTRADRVPLWIVDEPASKKTVSRVKTEDFRDDGCLAMPKSEKSVKSTDEHNTRVYKPVTRSVSLKKNLNLYREAGVSHVVRAEFDAAEYTDIVFTAYRLNKPYDVLTEQVIGGGIAQKNDLGVFWFDVGNFMRPWQDDEEVILIIEALHEHGAYCQVLRFYLDQGIDIQELGKLELEPIPVPKPVLNSAVSWTESKNPQVIGYSVYQGDIRANNEVIQAKEYSSSKDIILKLVIKGGYETVYNSGSKRSEYGPVVELPRVYAFTVYPNPFVKKTMINYALPEPGQVSIMVYDVTGRKIMTLVNDRVDPGYYQVHWSGRDDLGRQVSAGVYFMRMNTPGFNSQQKVIFVR